MGSIPRTSALDQRLMLLLLSFSVCLCEFSLSMWKASSHSSVQSVRVRPTVWCASNRRWRHTECWPHCQSSCPWCFHRWERGSLDDLLSSRSAWEPWAFWGANGVFFKGTVFKKGPAGSSHLIKPPVSWTGSPGPTEYFISMRWSHFPLQPLLLSL